VNGGANLFPRLYVALHRAAQSGDMARARALHALVMEVSTNLYQVGRHSSAIIKGLKCALSIEGVCDDFMAEPFHRFRDEQRRRIEQVLGELKEKIAAAVQ
jgi:4-hydroxy-tetrahydrodipicolinate synthase